MVLFLVKNLDTFESVSYVRNMKKLMTKSSILAAAAIALIASTVVSTMSFLRWSLTTGMYNAVAYTLNNHVAPTDIAVAAEQDSADGNTDVVYFDADYTTYCGFTWHGSGGGVIGHAMSLLHRDNAGTEIGCMPATLAFVVNYSSHDISHINANY